MTNVLNESSKDWLEATRKQINKELHEKIRKDLITKQEKHQLLAVESLQPAG